MEGQGHLDIDIKIDTETVSENSVLVVGLRIGVEGLRNLGQDLAVHLEISTDEGQGLGVYLEISIDEGQGLGVCLEIGAGPGLGVHLEIDADKGQDQLANLKKETGGSRDLILEVDLSPQIGQLEDSRSLILGTDLRTVNLNAVVCPAALDRKRLVLSCFRRLLSSRTILNICYCCVLILPVRD